MPQNDPGLHFGLNLFYFSKYYITALYLFVLRFTAQSTQWGHVERGQFTEQYVYWAGLVL